MASLPDDEVSQDEREEIAMIACGTTTGPIMIKLVKKWSPIGYERAVDLFKQGFYDSSHFFRTVPNFLVQFGLSYTTDKELRSFAESTIQDDPQLTPHIAFDEGVISYAGSGKNSRNSQLFISYGKSVGLGTQLWETPIGTIVQGFENVKNFYGGYGDMPPWGKGPTQQKIRHQGRKYMEENFPLTDSFLKCHVQISYEGDPARASLLNKFAKYQEGKINQNLRGIPLVEKEINDQVPGSATTIIGPLFPVIFVGILIFAFLFRRTRSKVSKTN
mmetsp:Transcript_20477/g.19703  ORF Transcript_20477/g.19703 Transcript_20477/m.19703 type:complete len:274 (-) Transcript_20477:397-1218(-)|eukprot:CAMPEP_0197836000 /NCGR_PEP_ID=MMETSP1437-20131217/27632_1 /TAXON_ID=49252 ORGANISM="Eucampia antarctica, Strain CCMP1452" /NCGR_SAMPLE_ID=MMETSP1437 /ASSEMBLY_ACC=CAM_ASM_001096 /LENGTH=273 /DNA_ID=CAMNT_0043441841 /DNA_START=54 /DNA_END=875 /DNA_ORIENTATION=+